MDRRVHRIGTNWAFKKLVDTGSGINHHTVEIIRLFRRRKPRIWMGVGDFIFIHPFRGWYAFNARFHYCKSKNKNSFFEFLDQLLYIIDSTTWVFLDEFYLWWVRLCCQWKLCEFSFFSKFCHAQRKSGIEALGVCCSPWRCFSWWGFYFSFAQIFFFSFLLQLRVKVTQIIMKFVSYFSKWQNNDRMVSWHLVFE